MSDTETLRVRALAKYLGVEPCELSGHDVMVRWGRDEYLVHTDAEASASARDAILSSARAFKTEFLSEHVKPGLEPVIEALDGWRAGACESANGAVLAMLADHDDFVSDAIAADGRGHFLAQYDFEEREVTVDSETFYIYRID
jgi:hypothetical protein